MGSATPDCPSLPPSGPATAGSPPSPAQRRLLSAHPVRRHLSCAYTRRHPCPPAGHGRPSHRRCRPPSLWSSRANSHGKSWTGSAAGGCCACGPGGARGAGARGAEQRFRKGGDPCRPARRPGWWESLGTRRCCPWRCRRWGPPRPWPAASDSPPAPRGPPAPGCRPWRSPAR